MVLVTGPTGSGKTNTLYSSIAKINTPETNIMTAEDPVEFNLAGVNQVQVGRTSASTFAAALRSFLRQDPEHHPGRRNPRLRNGGNRGQGALTGHLVLSTLHTNDAPSTDQPSDEHGHRALPRRQLRAPDLRPALVRRVCSNCKEPAPQTPEALMQAGFTAEDAAEVTPMKGAGCDKCNTTGYKGRVGLYEVMAIGES
jgi:Type II secretory pathway, ATPase PulE/Tfp pilus assembly pathway, ATPase PilB